MKTKRLYLRLGLLLLAQFFACLALANDLLPQNLVFDFSLLRGPISGFMQIPEGGTPATCSLHRPTFNELGIKWQNAYDFKLAANWHNLRLYAGYHFIHAKGSTTLNKPLTIHGITIPTGSHIESNPKFDLVRAGVKYSFYFLNNKLSLAPLLEINKLKFYYSIPTQDYARYFNSVVLRAGLYGEYDFTPKLALDSELIGAIPGFNLSIFTADLKLKYTLFQQPHFSPALFLGAGDTHLRFKDKQPMPNHIKLEQLYLSTGFEITV